MATATKSVDYNAILKKWQKDVEDVVGQMEGWFRTHPAHPNVVRSVVAIAEQRLGSYDASQLDAEFESEYPDTIKVVPLARNYPGRGAISITSWSNLRRVYLLQAQSSNGWIIYTDTNLPIHLGWDENGFHTLIDDLRDEL
jgi:hypothetical protein